MSFLGGIMGGGAGGIFGAALNMIGKIFPPLAIMSSLANMVTQALGEGIKGAVDQLAKESGLPKFLQDMIKKIVDEAVKGAQKESSPEVDAQTQKQVGEKAKDMSSEFQQDLTSGTLQNMGGKKGGGAKSWLEALAAALGDALNKQADKLKGMSEAITGDGKDQPKQMTELQAASQRFSFMMNAVDQVIKAIGEALSAAARKQ